MDVSGTSCEASQGNTGTLQRGGLPGAFSHWGGTAAFPGLREPHCLAEARLHLPKGLVLCPGSRVHLCPQHPRCFLWSHLTYLAYSPALR